MCEGADQNSFIQIMRRHVKAVARWLKQNTKYEELYEFPIKVNSKSRFKLPRVP